MLFPRAALTRVTVPVAILKADDDEVNRAPCMPTPCAPPCPAHRSSPCWQTPTITRSWRPAPPACCATCRTKRVDEDTRQSIHRILERPPGVLGTLGQAGSALPLPPATPEPEVQQAPPAAPPVANADIRPRQVQKLTGTTSSAQGRKARQADAPSSCSPPRRSLSAWFPVCVASPARPHSGPTCPPGHKIGKAARNQVRNQSGKVQTGPLHQVAQAPSPPFRYAHRISFPAPAALRPTAPDGHPAAPMPSKRTDS